MKVPFRPGRVLDAFRQTQSEVRTALETSAAQWMRVGAMLENACMLPPDQREMHLRSAMDSVRAALGAEQWAEGHHVDPMRPASESSLVGRFRTYCEIVEDAGALALSDAMLDAYVHADPTVDAVECGRVEAVRARLAWKAGDLEAATERYRRVAAAGRRERSDELTVRALIGQAIVARVSGNYPRVRERAQKAVALAERRQMRRLAAGAHQILTVAFAVARDFDVAVSHGWRSYEHSIGDPTMESEALAIIGQLFLDIGHPTPAAAAFRAVISRSPSDRLLLPSLGGLALAGARMGSWETVTRAQEIVTARAAAGATPYNVASTALDLARAWAELQVSQRAEEARGTALAIAVEHRFHEIAHHAEALEITEAPARLPLSTDAEEVADAVLHLVGA